MNIYFEQKCIPKFLSEKEKKRFASKQNSRIFVPKTIKTKNAWLTYSGLCFKLFYFWKSSSYQLAYSQFSYILQCIYNLVTKQHRRSELETFFVHSSWSMGNFHHWIVDSLPRFKPFLETTNEFQLLIPNSLYNQVFVKDFLALLGIKNINILHENEIAKLKSIAFSELTPGDFTINQDLKFMVEYLKSKCELKTESKPFRKIFLSRQKVGYRTIENNEKIVQILIKTGFEIIYTEDLDFITQVKLFNETAVLVSVHGAGLTNCIFMNKGCKILELHPSIENQNKIFNYIYWNLANHFELDYFFLGCEPVNQNERFHTANLVVDEKKLENMLNEIMTNL